MWRSQSIEEDRREKSWNRSERLAWSIGFCFPSASLCLHLCLCVELFASGSEPAEPVELNAVQALAHHGLAHQSAKIPIQPFPRERMATCSHR